MKGQGQRGRLEETRDGLIKKKMGKILLANSNATDYTVDRNNHCTSFLLLQTTGEIGDCIQLALCKSSL